MEIKPISRNNKSAKRNRADETRAEKLPAMPKWMECTWRRIPCGKTTCKICKYIMSREHATGPANEDIETAFENVGYHLKNALETLRQEARRMGVEISNLNTIAIPPKPAKFPLYRKTKQWRDTIFDLEMDAEETESWWLFTEAAADLFWYANILASKVYRQLCNRWHIQKDDGYGEFDYRYTQYVLGECLAITKSALHQLSLAPSDQKGQLMLAFSNFSKLEGEIKKI